MGKNQADKSMQRARLGSSSAAPDEVDDGMNQILRNNSMSMDDKISQLPRHILHHILCFLSQKNAVQTTVLSKSWRYLGSTRPKVEFRVQELEETHPYVVDEILQRYHDQEVSIQQFLVEMYDDFGDSKTISLLEKWVPIVVTNMGAKTLNLSLQSHNDFGPLGDFVLPSAVFQAEFLEELYLRGCILSRIEPTEKLLLKRLQKLSLIQVYIDNETFEKVMSNCPLIHYLALYCKGLRTIRVNNYNLKHFEFRTDWTARDCSIEIGHVPSLETIKVYDCPNTFDHRRLCLAHLKSLCLTRVRLYTTMPFDTFLSNFPGLEDLTLDDFYGFQEFKLSSRSIKRLAITKSREPIKATIDAPNMLYFKYSSRFLQSSISFTATCSHECESYIHMYEFLEDADNGYDRGVSSSWLYKIHELAKAFSQSKISIHLSQRFEDRNIKETMLLDNSTYTELLLVEQLTLDSHSPQSLGALMKCLFRIFRPRYIVEYHLLFDDEAKRHVESLNKILVAVRGRETQFWPQDLEDMIMVDTGVEEVCKPVKIGFRLKWKETEVS